MVNKNKFQTMSDIDRVLQAVENILSQQEENDCRQNVSETLRILYENYPNQKESINLKFNEMCRKYNKDFFKDMLDD